MKKNYLYLCLFLSFTLAALAQEKQNEPSINPFFDRAKLDSVQHLVKQYISTLKEMSALLDSIKIQRMRRDSLIAQIIVKETIKKINADISNACVKATMEAARETYAEITARATLVGLAKYCYERARVDSLLSVQKKQ